MRKALFAALMCTAALAACGKKEENVVVVPPPADSVTDPAVLAAADATAAGPAAAPAAVAPIPVPPNQPIRKAGLWQLTTTNDVGTQTGTLCVSEATENRRAGVFSTIGGPRRQGGGPGGGNRGPGGGGDGERRGPGGGDGERRGPGAGDGGGGQGGPGGGQGGPGAGAGERRGPGGGGGGGFGGGGGRGGGCTPKITKTSDGWTSTCSSSRERGDDVITMSTKLTLTGNVESKYTVKGATTTSGSSDPERNRSRPVSITGTYKGACPAGMKPGDYKGPDGPVRNILTRGGFGGGQGGGGQGGAR